MALYCLPEDEPAMDPESDEQEEVSRTPPILAAETIILNTARPSTTVIPSPVPTTLNFNFWDSRTHVPIIVKISGDDFKLHEIILVNPLTITLPILESSIIEAVRVSRSLGRRGNIKRECSLDIVRLFVSWEEGYLGHNGIKTNVHEGNVKAVIRLLGEVGSSEALVHFG